MTADGRGEPIAATITKKGRCAEDGYSEPYALLADGRTMPMGWNRSGPIFEVGTTGLATYVRSSRASLWHFEAAPDEPTI